MLRALTKTQKKKKLFAYVTHHGIKITIYKYYQDRFNG